MDTPHSSSFTLEDLRRKVELMEQVIFNFDKILNGTIYKPGLVDELRKQRDLDMEKIDRLHAQNVERMEKIEKNQLRIMWAAIGVYLVWGFLTGSGFATLEKVLKVSGVGGN